LDPELVFDMLDGILHGREAGIMLPDSYYFQRAIEYLENSPPVELMRLAQLEFGLIETLGFEGERYAVSLYKVLMSRPELFIELLCLVYKPRNSTDEPPTETSKQSAQNAWKILNACDRQPGTFDDETLTTDAIQEFVANARTMAIERDRIEVCDSTLGQIFARSPVGSDGVFPSEPVRDTIERFYSEEMLNGFTIGCFNKRGVTSRGMLDGGEQERALAEQYRANSKALEVKYPRLAASLEGLAKSYDRHGLAEDLEVRLRREG
jgi:hypothetical protein